MREVEIKAVLRDRDGVLNKLQEMGCVFSETDTQDDTVFVEKLGTVDEYLTNTIFIRIRVCGNGDTIFTVKQHINRQRDPMGVPTEHEVHVNSRDEMEKIVELFGFKEAVRLRKTRSHSAYKDWDICIDDVEDLGSFIEIEHLVHEGEDEKLIQSEMLDFLRALGIEENDLRAQRYDIAMLEKRGV